jgi:type VI protein secretion system component Hcp
MTLTIPRRRALVGALLTAFLAVAAITVLATGGARQPAHAAAAPAAEPPAAARAAEPPACAVPADPQPITRAVQAYARADGITGDAARPAQPGEFAVTGIRLGLTVGAPDLCNRMGGSRLATELLTIEKPVDKASIGLLQAAAGNRRIGSLQIRLMTTAADGRPTELLTYAFTDLQARSVRQSYTGTSLSEVVAFTFERAKVRYGVSEVEIAS